MINPNYKLELDLFELDKDLPDEYSIIIDQVKKFVDKDVLPNIQEKSFKWNFS